MKAKKSLDDCIKWAKEYDTQRSYLYELISGTEAANEEIVNLDCVNAIKINAILKYLRQKPWEKN